MKTVYFIKVHLLLKAASVWRTQTVILSSCTLQAKDKKKRKQLLIYCLRKYIISESCREFRLNECDLHFLQVHLCVG